MGSGASGLSEQVSKATDDELKAEAAKLSSEQKEKVLAALKAAQSGSQHILMVLTSCAKLGDTDQQTGWYLPELAHPYDCFKKAGFKMTFASPKGGLAPIDEGSIDASKEDKGCMDFWNDEEIKKLVANTVALKDVKSDGIDAVVFVGGYGTMWDFPDDPDVQRLAAEVYEKGGITSAICHGPAALVNVKLADGSLLIKGKEVTAFTNGEEDAVDRRKIVEKNPFTIEDKFKELGATFKDGGVFQANVIVDGRLITGQNPPSAGAFAEAVREELKIIAGKAK